MIFLLMLVITSVNLNACDVCSLYMNVGMNDNKNSIGFSFRSQFFKATIWEEMVLANPYKHFGDTELPELIDKTVFERYETYELRGQYFFNPKWSIFASLPIKHAVQTIENKETVNVSGIADPTLLLKYKLMSSKSNCETAYTHRTIVGGGIKFPLGNTQKMYDGEYVINDMQMGSGSYDFVVSAEHVSMYNDLGVNVNYIYYIKTANLGDYRFGNSYSLQTNVFYNFKIEKSELRPSAGFYFESDKIDYQGEELVGSTESSRGFATFGIEYAKNNFSVYGNLQQAVINKTVGVQLEATQRIVAGVKFYIK